jgi:gamma-glutamylcyclotransferase (GGCT)/AIG2-like uncharacterized protein YtfP
MNKNDYFNVAVYWTLKRGYHNHRVMESAEWEFLTLDFVQIENLGECWFPYITLSEISDKWLEVEVYRVHKDNLRIIDWLEWYQEWREDNHYNRKIVTTLLEDNVFIYEYNRPIDSDTLENHFVRSVPSPRFYSWSRR